MSSHQQQFTDTEVKDFILKWFNLTREEKRKFDWQSKHMIIYSMLIPLFFDQIQLDQLTIPPNELSQKFNRFFASGFRMKIVNNSQDQIYNLNENFLFTLDKEIHVTEIAKKSFRNQQKNRKFSAILFNSSISPWNKIENLRIDCSNNIRLTSFEQGQQAKIIYADKNIVNRFKLDVLKQDYQIKTCFVNNFLFCNTTPSYSINSVMVEKLKRGQVLQKIDQKIHIVFDGTVTQQIQLRHTNKLKNSCQALGEKWKFLLARGSLIGKNFLKPILLANSSSEFIQNQVTENYKYTYTLQTDTVFITISHIDLAKILKSQKIIKKLIMQRIQQTQTTHLNIIQKSLAVKQSIKDSQSNPVQLFYSIPRHKKTKAFRKKTQILENDYEEFITFDKFLKMTQNKQNVEKKHLIYSQLNNLLRQKQKQDRFIKKLHTEKGMKQIKKCEYLARLKQNKIQNLAIKDSILNTVKYRDKPHQIKFIFEEQMMDKYIKNQSVSQNSVRRRRKKWISMVQQMQQQNSDGLTAKTTIKQQNYEGKSIRFHPQTKFLNKKLKMIHCQSSPNLADITNITKNKKQSRIGSAMNLKKQDNKWM